MKTESILLIMKAINGQIPEIKEYDYYDTHGARCSGPDHKELTDFLDNNPLFEGKHKPTNGRFWNVWQYIGPKKVSHEE